MNPQVSIIIPVYNANKGKDLGIDRCLQSVLNQEYQDYEVICVDDGSSDGSAEVLDTFASRDARVHVIHKKNGGVSKARNTALKNAHGKYIQFMDADDWIPKDSTKNLVRTMETKGVDLVIADFYRVVGNNVARKGCISSDDVLTIQQFAELMMDSPADYYYGVLWNKLYKTDLIQEYDLKMDEDLNWCEDFIFNLEYLLHVERVAALQIPVYYYVKTKGSLVSQTMSLPKVVAMKTNVFNYYNNFYRHILDEKEYRKSRLNIASFLVSAAKDDSANPIRPSTKKLGKEKVIASYDPNNTASISSFAYYVEKVHDSYMNNVALKHNLGLNDVKVMSALLTSNEVTSSEEIADYTGISQLNVSVILTRLQMNGLVSMDMLGGKMHFTLSDEAAEIGDDIVIALQDLEQTTFRGFDKEEKDRISNDLNQMTENLKKVL